MVGALVLFLLIVLAGTAGELCVSRAMKSVGEVNDFRPGAVAGVIFRAMRVGWMWAGILLMTLAFFSLLGVLSFENVSFVVPVSALSYLAGAAGGVIFLGEHVSLQRWIGILLVVVGVALVILGKR
jgi:drug/metabolite transporter (DMT)-like permease